MSDGRESSVTGDGDDGVDLVGPGVGVDFTPGMTRRVPTMMRLGSRILLARVMVATETPYFRAMEVRVSPRRTMWVVPPPAVSGDAWLTAGKPTYITPAAAMAIRPTMR